MSGILILTIIIIFVLFMAAFGFYCHFCFGESGGRSLEIMQPGLPASAPAAVAIVKRKCRCSDKFKGLCKNCEGADFVGADGGDRAPPDFEDFGGDAGFGDSDGNPIQSLIKDNSHNTNTSSATGGGVTDSVVYTSNYTSNDYY